MPDTVHVADEEHGKMNDRRGVIWESLVNCLSD